MSFGILFEGNYYVEVEGVSGDSDPMQRSLGVAPNCNSNSEQCCRGKIEWRFASYQSNY
jgi:hypothetical protein